MDSPDILILDGFGWMMMNGAKVFFLFTFPLIGLFLDFFVSKRKRLYLLIGAAILSIPLFFAYAYVVSVFNLFVVILLLSSAFSFLSHKISVKSVKIILASGLSFSLFIALGVFAFINVFAGSSTLKHAWSVDGYRIESFYEAPFVGKHAEVYHLRKYGIEPFFSKYLETSMADTLDDCKIYFEANNLVFDRCKVSIEKFNH